MQDIADHDTKPRLCCRTPNIGNFPDGIEPTEFGPHDHKRLIYRLAIYQPTRR